MDVVCKYALTLILVACGIVLTCFVAKVTAKRIPSLATNNMRLVYFLVGCCFLLVSAIGRIGWSIQTLAGDSPAERLDKTFFLILSGLGTFFLVLEYCIGRFRET
jgi:hypothetical protein